MKLLRCILLIIALLVVNTTDAFARVKWCGIYARAHLVRVDPGPAYNLACNWKHWGNASSAREGAMVVWCTSGHHHVGKITGPCDGDMCVVTSGNDGHQVKTRKRSVAGATFRSESSWF